MNILHNRQIVFIYVCVQLCTHAYAYMGVHVCAFSRACFLVCMFSRMRAGVHIHAYVVIASIIYLVADGSLDVGTHLVRIPIRVGLSKRKFGSHGSSWRKSGFDGNQRVSI